MEQEKLRSVFRCCVCERKIEGDQMYILGAFHLDRKDELHFCSIECFNEFFDIQEEFEKEESEE